MADAEKYTNLGSSTLNGGITAGATSLIVTSASTFPTVSQFRIIIDSEIFIVTGVSGATFTVVPGSEGTSQASHSNGVAVTEVLTAGAMQRLPTKGRLNAIAYGNIIM